MSTVLGVMTAAASTSPPSLLPTEGGAMDFAMSCPEMDLMALPPLLLDLEEATEREPVGVAVFTGDPPTLKDWSRFVTDPITEPSLVVTTVPSSRDTPADEAFGAGLVSGVAALGVAALGVAAFGVSALGVAALVVPSLGNSALGNSALGVAALGVSALGVAALGVAALGVSALGVSALVVTALGVAALGVSALGDTSLGVSVALAGIGATGVGALADTGVTVFSAAGVAEAATGVALLTGATDTGVTDFVGVFETGVVLLGAPNLDATLGLRDPKDLGVTLDKLDMVRHFDESPISKNKQQLNCR